MFRTIIQKLDEGLVRTGYFCNSFYWDCASIESDFLKARGMANIAKNGNAEVLQQNFLKVFRMILSFRNQESNKARGQWAKEII